MRICAGCKQIVNSSHRCAELAARAKKRGTTSQRGYGSSHQRTRKLLLPHAYGRACPLCHQPMLPGQKLDLDHSTPLADDPHSRGDRIAHANCNRGRR